MPKINPILYLKSSLIKEQQNWILNSPIIFACGIIFYFFCQESNYFIPISLLIFGVFLANISKTDLLSLIPITIILFVSGFCWAQFYDQKFIQAAQIKSAIYGVVIGKISQIKEYENGKKKLIIEDLEVFHSKFNKNNQKNSKKRKKKNNLSNKPLKINKNTEKSHFNLAGYVQFDRNLSQKSAAQQFINGKLSNPPQKISLLLRKKQKTQLNIGDIIKSKILLQPILKSEPLDSFNLSQYNYFQQIGGQGFIIGPIKIIAKNLKNSSKNHIDIWRYKLAAKIKNDFSNQDNFAIFTALILGIRDFIAPDLLENIRKSGLAHLLAISGLHLSLAGGIFFLFFRFSLSQSAYLTLNFDLKKIAAICAIFASLGYLIITGLPIPAIRAFFMILLVFLAILLNRNTNPLRSLAFGAFIILILNPTSLFQISFQMSFCAVFALIIFYNFIKKYQTPEHEETNYLRKFIYYFLGIIISSLIAQIALAPLTIYYFNNFSLYGILANLIAVPLTSLIIMPLAFLYLFLMIFDCGFMVIYPINLALDYIIAYANWIGQLPSSTINISLISQLSVIIMILGLIWLGIWQTNWRYFGLLAILFGAFLAYKTPLPDLIIDGKRQFIAIYDKKDGLFFSKKPRQSIRLNNLLQKMAISEVKTFDKMPNQEIFCQYRYCQATIKDHRILALTKRNKISEICQKDYDILINLSKYKLPTCLKNPDKKIINNTHLLKNGSQYFYF